MSEQSIKLPIITDEEGVYDDKSQSYHSTQDTLHAVNMLFGGVLANLVTDPSWENKVKKAGLGLLHTLDKPENTITLLFQYNPQNFKETFSVSYNYRQSYAGEPTITEFKSVEPQKLFIEFYLDAYYDYAGLDEYYKNMVAGASQSALVLAGAGSRGFSEATFALDRPESNSGIVYKDKRTLKPALDNLRKFVKNTYYKITKANKSGEETSENSSDEITYTGNPPLCILNWGDFHDFKCVVRDMSFEHTKFNPVTLDPIRTKVIMELEEYYNPFLEKVKASFDGEIKGWATE